MIFGKVEKVKSDLTSQQLADMAASGYVVQQSANLAKATNDINFYQTAKNVSLSFGAAGVTGVIATAAVAPALLPAIGVGLLASSAASLAMTGFSALMGRKAKDNQYEAESALYAVKGGNFSGAREYIDNVLSSRETVDKGPGIKFSLNRDKLQELASKHIEYSAPKIR